jgi:thioredoxin 1
MLIKRFLKMKKTIVLTTLTVLLIVGISTSASAQKQTGTQFYAGSFDNLLREAKKQNKTVLLDFWATWCSPCHRLDKETFANKSFGNFANQNILVYKVDIDSKDGQEIVAKYGVQVFPSMVLIDVKKGKMAEYKGFYAPNLLQKEIAKTADVKGIYLPFSTNSILARK